MSGRIVDAATESLTFKDMPSFYPFVANGHFYMKTSPRDAVQVVPTAEGGWMGYGSTFKWPAHDVIFERLGEERSHETLQREMYSGPPLESSMRWLWWWLGAFGFLVIAVIIAGHVWG